MMVRERYTVTGVSYAGLRRWPSGAEAVWLITLVRAGTKECFQLRLVQPSASVQQIPAYKTGDDVLIDSRLLSPIQSTDA